MPTTPNELSDIAKDLKLLDDELEQNLRARKIRQGIDPDAPEPTEEERRSNLEALQADNEAKHRHDAATFNVAGRVLDARPALTTYGPPFTGRAVARPGCI